MTSKLCGFAAGDRINLANVQANSLSYANGTLTLLGANNVVVDTLLFAGQYKTADFALQREGQTTDVVYAGGNTFSPPPDFNFQITGHAPPTSFVTEPLRMAMPHGDGLPFSMTWLHR